MHVCMHACSMEVCMYVCIYDYICMCVCMYLPTYLTTYLSICLSIYVYARMCMYIFICMRMSAHVCVCMYGLPLKGRMGGTGVAEKKTSPFWLTQQSGFKFQVKMTVRRFAGRVHVWVTFWFSAWDIVTNKVGDAAGHTVWDSEE